MIPRALFAQTIARLFISAAFAVVALGISGAMMWQVFSLYSESVVAADALSQAKAQQESVVSAEALARDTKREREELESLIIARNGAVDFISSVERLGTVSGVELKIVSATGKPPTKDMSGSLTLMLQFSGSFSSDMRFMKLLETMPISGTLGSVSMNRVVDEDGIVWRGSATFTVLSNDIPS